DEKADKESYQEAPDRPQQVPAEILDMLAEGHARSVEWILVISWRTCRHGLELGKRIHGVRREWRFNPSYQHPPGSPNRTGPRPTWFPFLKRRVPPWCFLHLAVS